MANLGETVNYDAAIYQLERADAVDAGVGGNGLANLQPKQLANRTAWLKAAIDTLQLTPARTLQDLKNLLAGDSTAATSQATSTALQLAGIAQGRLTLLSGNSLPTSDLTAITNLYYTPHAGDLVSLWNTTNSRWDTFQFTERSLSLSGLAANTNFDIFLYSNTSVLTLEAVAWSSSGAGTSVRAQALSSRNGVLVKTSDNRRYLGTIRTTATTGQCEDSLTKRYVFNTNNQSPRILKKTISGVSWTYSSATWRAANNDTTNRVEIVLGASISTVLNFSIGAGMTTTNASALIGLGLNTISPTSNLFERFSASSTGPDSLNGFWATSIPAGYHFIQQSESAFNALVVNFEGTLGQIAGIEGFVNI